MVACEAHHSGSHRRGLWPRLGGCHDSLRRAAALVAVVACVALAGCGSNSASQTASQPAQTGHPVVVASGIPFAANLGFDTHGGLWVISITGGASSSNGVWYVPSGGHPRHVLSGLVATALSWVGNSLLVAEITGQDEGQVTAFEDFNGEGFSHHHVVLKGLPIGSHTIGSIVEGSDGRLFTGYGSLEDHTGPPGRVLSFTLSGGAPVLEATGLRTAFGLAFWGHVLLVSVNGPDELGSLSTPDELQAFEPGGSVVNFGFPKCYDQGGSACAGVPTPLATFPAHSSPEGVAVKGDIAFVANFGSSFGQGGNNIVRVDLHTRQQSVFWSSPTKNQLVGLAIGPDGDLYATLLTSGEVVRFAL